MRYEARHAPCGTAVADDLPEGYPVDEGVGLWCPRCRAAFWSVPEAAEAEVGPQPDARPQPEAGARPAPPGPPPRRRVLRLGPVIGLIAATAVAALIAVLVATSGGGGRRAPARSPAPTPSPAAATPTAPRSATAAPAGPARVTRRVGRVPVSIALPAGWQVRTAGHRVTATGPGGARVTVSWAPRLGRSLRRLGRDTRSALHPGGRVPIRPARLGGRPAARVTAHGREVTALVLGSRRWVVARDVANGGRAVARSVRIG